MNTLMILRRGNSWQTVLAAALLAMFMFCITSRSHNEAAQNVSNLKNQDAKTAIPLEGTAYSVEEIDKRENEYGTYFDAVFILQEPHIRVPLMHCDRPSVGDEGMSVGPVTPYWLVRDKLLWIGCETTPQSGSGHVTHQVHVIVRIEKNSSREIARQAFTVNEQSGVENWKSLAVTFAPGGNGYITRTVTKSSSDRDNDKPCPLAVKWNERQWIVQYELEERTCYQVGNDLHELSHSAVLDLSKVPFSDWPKRSFTLDEVVEFLVLLAAPRYAYTSELRSSPQVLPEERDRMLRELREKNPDIDKWPDLNRRITIPSTCPTLCPQLNEQWGFWGLFSF